MLAIVVGSLLAGTVLYYGGKRVATVFTSRQDRISALDEEIELKDAQLRRGAQARRLLDEYATRALPDDPNLANSRYRAWLLEWVENAGITGAVKWVKASPAIVDKDRVHDIHEFSVTCEADLRQLVRLLYDFYAQDYLHRIRSLKATPTKNKTLALNLIIDAVAMPGVQDRELDDMPSKRLALGSLDNYLNQIVGRNPYAPANKPPKFASNSTQTGYVNQPMSFSPEVSDPENGELSYRIEHNGLDGLTIDEQSGRIEWTPPATGEYEILVYATDDGLPAKEAQQTIRLAVSDPPPEPEREEPRPTFDEAKYTFVTGIVQVNGRWQVWLTVRTEGKWLRLFEGDTFQVGAMEGRIERIHPRDVEISTGDALISVRFGKSLHEGQLLRRLDEEVAASSG
jgi:hypothetical protein